PICVRCSRISTHTRPRRSRRGLTGSVVRCSLRSPPITASGTREARAPARVDVGRHGHAWAVLRRPSWHGMSVAPGREDGAFPPALTRDKLLERERHDVRLGGRGETHKPRLPTATSMREPPPPGHQLLVWRCRPAQLCALPSPTPPCEGVLGADERGACRAVTQFAQFIGVCSSAKT